MNKIIPAGMSFHKALVFGYTGRIEYEPYLEWIREQPCFTCGAPPRSDPSHVDTLKGNGTKSPDWLAIPQCRRCHDQYEWSATREDHVEHVSYAAIMLLQAIYEGKLVWRKK